MEEIRVTNAGSAVPAGRRVSRHQGVSRPSSPLASRVRLFVFGVGFGFRDCLPRIIFPPIPSTNRRDKSVDIILWLFLRCVFGWEGSGGRPCFCRFWILGMAQILVGIGSVSSQYGESSRRRCGNVAYGTCVGSLAHWQRGYPGTCNLYNVAYQTWSVWFINSRFLSMDFETFLNSLLSFLFVFVAEVDQWMKILHFLCFFSSFVFCFFPFSLNYRSGTTFASRESEWFFTVILIRDENKFNPFLILYSVLAPPLHCLPLPPSLPPIPPLRSSPLFSLFSPSSSRLLRVLLLQSRLNILVLFLSYFIMPFLG